jgi:hypothetical protein
MDGFGFDIGGGRRPHGGHGHGGHGHGGHGHGGRKKHHHHHQQQDDGGGGGGGGGGDFGPPPMPDDDSGDDSGDSGGDMGFEGGCHCGGTCESCNVHPLGFTGHIGPDLYPSGHNHPMGDDNDDFGCDQLGSCKRYPMGIAPLGSNMGWEFDGPGNFGSELGSRPQRFAGDPTLPILSTWGRYPSGSPYTGIFAGDPTLPILSTWGRYPSGSPYAGVFAGDDDPMVMPMDTITASPSAGSTGSGDSFANALNSVSGVLNVVDQVAKGAGTMIAATRAPVPAAVHASPSMAALPPPSMTPSALPPGHPHRRRRNLAPLPYYTPYYPPPPPPPRFTARTPPGYPGGYPIGWPYDLGY